jgi:hypothetical protein
MDFVNRLDITQKQVSQIKLICKHTSYNLKNNTNKNIYNRTLKKSTWILLK